MHLKAVSTLIFPPHRLVLGWVFQGEGEGEGRGLRQATSYSVKPLEDMRDLKARGSRCHLSSLCSENQDAADTVLLGRTRSHIDVPVAPARGAEKFASPSREEGCYGICLSFPFQVEPKYDLSHVS